MPALTVASLERRIARLQRVHGTHARTVDIDPVEMARRCGIEPDDWQVEFLRCEDQDTLVNCSRQTGKSQMAAIKGMHEALKFEQATILLLSPSIRQSSELFRKCMTVYNRLNRPIEPLAESALRLELVNGSRVISLPGREETIRGVSAVTRLIMDEASRIPDELYTAVSPMLAVSNGKRTLLSTPWGARGAFYRAWRDRENWRYFEVPATRCPRISTKFLEKERREMGEWLFEQEYMCKFRELQSASFRAEDLENIISTEVEAWIL
jgi:Terminase large subunit, T4likevirus-type, N-terminal